MEPTETTEQKDPIAEKQTDNNTECKMCKFVLAFSLGIFFLVCLFVFVSRMEKPVSSEDIVLPNELPVELGAE